MTQKSRFVVSRDWLLENLKTPGVRIVDASWYLPASGRNGKAEFEEAHIPGAIFFDQDEIADHSTGLPHSLPSPQLFAHHMGAVGITPHDTIVVYDGLGYFSAPRVWWMFRIMGAKNVLILDGGFDGWKKAGFPVTAEKTKVAGSLFKPHFDANSVVTFDEMLEVVGKKLSQIADARGKGRFTAQEAEPRAGMRSGHMPGARNVPVTEIAENGELKPLDELRRLFEKAGIDLSKPVITSCGSGVTAAALIFALASLGHEQLRLYDGSWSEWGGRDDTPVATGEADA
ncbi:thiosulfate/3-mercaptopyruvate sulfurtransferase [Paenochrobactrum gallinarii]|uniref:3-mercaptopyruvate sulfurtransferase n=1 Tax=Paenochrobactrum gallinarii TaxID=643673 RepID=A0A841LPU9_9HYPH|nr:3-mercaptopyruvate sulfurtransferase [Paenochrobactrum gallinarii]MBB6260063.1 thiosulfate/3-mercaptopyruvate sulfurtransferase [Paenochrobactrum gallinarii]